MGSLQFKRAQRKRVKLKIGISAPSGGGKTLSSLILAYGIVKGEHPDWSEEDIWGSICVIDTENGSAELYVGMTVPESRIKIGEYNVISLQPPFTADKYIEAIELAKDNDIEVCVLDSASHIWMGKNGLLEQQSNIAKRTGNGYTSWRDITPQWNKFVDAILQTDMHMIVTVRSKTEYVQEKDEKGHTTIRKVGLAPQIRDGFEYELSMFLDLDVNHMAEVSKDRSGVIEQYSKNNNKYFLITPQLGIELANWLAGGAVEKKTEAPIMTAASEAPKTSNVASAVEIADFAEQVASLGNALVKGGKVSGVQAANIVRSLNPDGTPNIREIKDMDVLTAIYNEFNSLAE
jgi:hypothetical protein